MFSGAVLSSICPELRGSCVRLFEDIQGDIALAENPLRPLGAKISACVFILLESYFVRRRSKSVHSFQREAHGYFDETLSCDPF